MSEFKFLGSTLHVGLDYSMTKPRLALMGSHGRCDCFSTNVSVTGVDEIRKHLYHHYMRFLEQADACLYTTKLLGEAKVSEIEYWLGTVEDIKNHVLAANNIAEHIETRQPLGTYYQELSESAHSKHEAVYHWIEASISPLEVLANNKWASASAVYFAKHDMELIDDMVGEISQWGWAVEHARQLITKILEQGEDYGQEA